MLLEKTIDLLAQQLRNAKPSKLLVMKHQMKGDLMMFIALMKSMAQFEARIKFRVMKF